jgi:hypothetical protein
VEEVVREVGAAALVVQDLFGADGGAERGNEVNVVHGVLEGLRHAA